MYIAFAQGKIQPNNVNICRSMMRVEIISVFKFIQIIAKLWQFRETHTIRQRFDGEKIRP